ncbi:MAG: AI-2E family transporter [Gemmatimonadota bacterium]|nr:AI-2E family transporter [Gemmatimonadota bacterium]
MAKNEPEQPELTGSLKAAQLQRRSLLVLVLGISLLFLVMIRSFLVTVILAAVVAGMTRPAYLVLVRRLDGRNRLASIFTVLGLLLLVLVPLSAFLALVVSQAAQVTELADPWIRGQSSRWPEFTAWLESLPLVGQLIPDQGALAARAGELVSRIGTFLFQNVGTATAGTVNVVLQLFVMLYAVYFFLIDGPSILEKALYYLPLPEAEERALMGRFVSVARATIKGSILVGLIQGALAGGAFFVLRLPAAAFWATVMAVLSVIPVLGSGIIWAPAAVILLTTGRPVAGIGLAIYGILIVSTADNFLRPRFIGRDTKMHDLLVLLSTFGGLAMFGLSGFIVGPIVAALFVTSWELYGAAFRELLPEAPHFRDE